MLVRECLCVGGDDLKQVLVDCGVEGDVLGCWIEFDVQRCELFGVVEEKKCQCNELSKQIGQFKKVGEDVDEQIVVVGVFKKEIEVLEIMIESVEIEFEIFELFFLNVGYELILVGVFEEDNVFVCIVGDKLEFGFEVVVYWDVGFEFGVFDFECGVKIIGVCFIVYCGFGVCFECVLVNFMFDLYGKVGYVEMLLLFFVNEVSMFGFGQLLKFVEDVFCVEEYGYYLILMLEVLFVNLYCGEMFDEVLLLLCYFVWMLCFCVEVGSYGKDVCGLICQYQFFKVEFVQFIYFDQSYEVFEQFIV